MMKRPNPQSGGQRLLRLVLVVVLSWLVVGCGGGDGPDVSESDATPNAENTENGDG